jgi:MFS family permease
MKNRIIARFGYENVALIVLSLVCACTLFDRLTVSFLSPFIATGLRLSTFQIGLLASALSTTNAISGYVVGGLSDRSNHRKTYLLACVFAFALFSSVAGLAPSFLFLAASRFLTGFGEGPAPGIALSIMSIESSEHRRGFNLGFLQNFPAFIIAQFLEPIVIIRVAAAFGWRAGFYMASIPSLCVAFLILWLVRNPKEEMPIRAAAAQPDIQTSSFAALFRYRNVLICAGIAALMGSWLLLQMTFLPLYLVRKVGLTSTQTGVALSMIGITGSLASLALPALSDRIRRKPVMLGAALWGVVGPLGVLSFHSFGAATASILMGAISMGCIPIYIAIIPSDYLPSRMIAQAIGFSMAMNELIGGIVSPAVGGKLADLFGLGTPLWMAAAATLLAACLVLFLQESCPLRLKSSPTLRAVRTPKQV